MFSRQHVKALKLFCAGKGVFVFVQARVERNTVEQRLTCKLFVEYWMKKSEMHFQLENCFINFTCRSAPTFPRLIYFLRDKLRIQFRRCPSTRWINIFASSRGWCVKKVSAELYQKRSLQLNNHIWVEGKKLFNDLLLRSGVLFNAQCSGKIAFQSFSLSLSTLGVWRSWKCWEKKQKICLHRGAVNEAWNWSNFSNKLEKLLWWHFDVATSAFRLSHSGTRKSKRRKPRQWFETEIEKLLHAFTIAFGELFPLLPECLSSAKINFNMRAWKCQAERAMKNIFHSLLWLQHKENLHKSLYHSAIRVAVRLFIRFIHPWLIILLYISDCDNQLKSKCE